MGKLNPKFAVRANDGYPTFDRRAVPPLLARLGGPVRFVEPCAGDGALIDNLESFGFQCGAAWDICPRRADIEVADASTAQVPAGLLPITNPPWTRRLMHPIIANLAAQGPVWCLFDARWIFSKQARTLLRLCHEVVAVGRLQWVEGTDYDHTIDVAWYKFGPNAPPQPLFFGRA